MKTFQTTPVLQVADLAKAIDYYTTVLRFELLFQWGEPAFYAGVRYNDVTVHLNMIDSVADRCGKGAFYIFCEAGIETYYDAVVAAGAIVVDGPPALRPYEMIDCKLADPDGNWISIGQEAPKDSTA